MADNNLFKENLLKMKGSLKNIFEHLRNYIICATLFTAGLSAIRHSEWDFVGEFGHIVGFIVIIVALILTIMNSVEAFSYIKNTFKPTLIPGTHRTRGDGFLLFMFLMYFSFVYILIAISVRIKF